MSETPLKFSEMITWPETMWPSNLSIFDDLPEILRPEVTDLEELKYPWEALTLMLKILEERITEREILTEDIGQFVSIEGPVLIEEGVKIFPFASIVGPTYIGRNSIIGQHTQIRGSVVGSSSKVGVGAEVVRTVDGGDCTHHESYAGDSLLMRGVHLGGNSGPANLRGDGGEIAVRLRNGDRVNSGLTKLGVIAGEGARFSTHSATMPGVMIGRDSVIGPGVKLFKNLPDFTLAIFKQQPVEFRRID